ncbi:lycopene cyclase [Tsuneonella suprasediminis]|uniref:Lycopene cyclase n=1 Tax=Tsuneonella suprasediminis TaxID=2306996 RepID=A0A419R2E2_9SPHN|nr:lycopene beta-cyclase CrtY [Tsuneonella suprasediminis]RJX68101.1 lycopene cyclase [Tsuneonella suprasediminis]
MTARRIDMAIAGGGLAGGLIALALHRARPEFTIALVEQGPMIGGNHRWSWFASDLDADGAALLSGFRTASWGGYDVRFPGYRRDLGTAYHSLASVDFDAALRRELAEGALIVGRSIHSLDARGIDLDNGERIEARTVIDCRGIDSAAQLTGGWQVFIGRHLRTPRPHGIARPTIMDADVEQYGAYRFVYTLPLGAQDLFVEDTYYADTPQLDRNALSGRIDRYCQRAGWQGNPVGFETGVLPVITGGNFAAFQAAHRIDGVAVAGTRGGFMHPLTSYSLPFAVETALAIARDADLPGVQLAAMLEGRARQHWSRTRFYRQLGRMLFRAGSAEERWRIFARFYRLPRPLIERFYAAQTTRLDRARVLCGKPPVPVMGALAALVGQGRALERDAA